MNALRSTGVSPLAAAGAFLVLLVASALPLQPGSAQRAAPVEAPQTQPEIPEPKRPKPVTERPVTPETTIPEAKELFADEVYENQFELTEGYSSGREDGDGGLTQPPEAVTTDEAITFVDTRQEAFALAIGPEGRVFALDAAGNIFLWSNTRRDFLEFEGELARMAVGPDGTLWGVNSLGRVFFFDGKRWSQVRGEVASDIDVNRNGDVVLARDDELIERLDQDLNRFVVEAGPSGLQVALFSDGSLVTIHEGNLVYRCEDGTCIGLDRRAKSLSIGPDDSLFIVDTGGRLLRSTDRGESFTFIPTLGRTVRRVAVGPNGFPWVVTVDDEVLSSRFFARDESGDTLVRLAAAGNTVGTGKTGGVISTQQTGSITFNRTLRFDTFRSENDRFSTMIDLVVGNDGGVYIAGSQLLGFTIAIDKFDERRRRFVNIDYPFPDDVARFDVEEDGTTFWGIHTQAPVEIYRARNGGASVTTYSVPDSTGSGSDIALDHDGNVYAVVGERVYVKTRSSAQFRLFSNEQIRTIAFGMDENIWITDGGNIVLRFDGKRYVSPVRRETKVGGVAVAVDGSVFVIAGDDNGNPKLFRWNASNRSFDGIRNTTPDLIDVADDGELWFTQGLDVKRARNR
ncbi:MAG: tectonin domain-containing protein [Parvibaculum sp.]|uniref:tectonin domain-containing protein n=1 Tax=Parvibaculum sp. TaxID=2024848 RepID=UPI003267E4F3